MVKIHEAALQGDLGLVTRLARLNPAHVDVPDSEKTLFTPLLNAARSGHVEIVRFLLDVEARIDHRDSHGCTAIYYAALNRNVKCVELLLERGADATIGNKFGRTPLMWAAIHGYPEIVSLLIKHFHMHMDMDVCRDAIDSTSDVGRSALWLACSNGRSEVVEMLLDAGADPTLANGQGLTPLQVALWNNNKDCAMLLNAWHTTYSVFRARRLLDGSLSLGPHMHTHTHVPSNANNNTAINSNNASNTHVAVGSGKNTNAQRNKANTKRCGAIGAPAYLAGRLGAEKDRQLPMVAVEAGENAEGGKRRAGEKQDDWFAQVARYVVEGLPGDLFIEMGGVCAAGVRDVTVRVDR